MPIAGASMLGGVVRPALAPLGKDFSVDQAARLMQEQALDAPAAAAAIEGARGRPVTPGVRPLTAEVARDPGIAGLSRSIGNNSVADGARIGQRAQENMLAREAAVNAAAGAGDPEAVRTAAGTVGARMEQKVERAVDGVGPAMVPEASVSRRKLSKAESKPRRSPKRSSVTCGDMAAELSKSRCCS